MVPTYISNGVTPQLLLEASDQGITEAKEQEDGFLKGYYHGIQDGAFEYLTPQAIHNLVEDSDIKFF